MDLSLQHILEYVAEEEEEEEEDMLNRIFTGEKSRVHHYQPESKRASVQWKPLLLSAEHSVIHLVRDTHMQWVNTNQPLVAPSWALLRTRRRMYAHGILSPVLFLQGEPG
jgi:hypothetical protein